MIILRKPRPNQRKKRGAVDDHILLMESSHNSIFNIHYLLLIQLQKALLFRFNLGTFIEAKLPHLQLFEDELRAECVSLLPTAHRLS